MYTELYICRNFFFIHDLDTPDISSLSLTTLFRSFEFFRNENLNARNFFQRSNPMKPEYRRNQYGGLIGGPIAKDRTFFFADYQGDRKSTRLNSSHPSISYAVFCLKKKKKLTQCTLNYISVVTFSLFMISIPPTSPLFPSRRSSDLSNSFATKT